jgi:hypothetical protein
METNLLLRSVMHVLRHANACGAGLERRRGVRSVAMWRVELQFMRTV